MNTMESNYVFAGIRFEFPEDFEKAFRPTKWSIKKYMQFVNSLPINMRVGFVDYSLTILSEYYTDKDTSEFLQNIHRKVYSNFIPKKNPLEVAEGRENDLIKAFAQMKKDGIISSSATEIANLLKKRFNVKYSLSTIKYKLYNEISFVD